MKLVGLMMENKEIESKLKELMLAQIDTDYRTISITSKDQLFKEKLDFCIIEDSFDNQGINYAKEIIDFNNDLLVLIISKDGATVFDAIGINISNYLRYQDLDQKFIPAIWNMIDYLDKRKLILFKSDHGIISTQTNEIVYFEYLNRMTYLNTIDKTYRIIIQNFESLYKLLPTTFFQISRSIIINIFRLVSLDNERVTMKNHETKDLAISRRRYSQLVATLKKHAISFTEGKVEK